LKKIDIPLSVKKIGRDCFQFCYKLKKVSIPMPTAEFNKYCLDLCDELTEVNVKLDETHEIVLNVEEYKQLLKK